MDFFTSFLEQRENCNHLIVVSVVFRNINPLATHVTSINYTASESSFSGEFILTCCQLLKMVAKNC